VSPKINPTMPLHVCDIYDRPSPLTVHMHHALYIM